MASRLRALFSRHPMLGNMVVYGTLYGGSEFTQQTIQGREKYDWTHIGRLAVTGGLFFAPLYFQWYKRLDLFLPGNHKRAVLAKVCLDQGIIGAFGAFAFFAVVSGLEGKSAEDSTKEAVAKWPRTYFTGWVYWPIVQLINFRFLPTSLRAPYVAVNMFIWANFLCYVKSLKHEDPLALTNPST